MRLDPQIEDLLKSSGLPWKVRRSSKNHFVITISGRVTASIPQNGGKDTGRYKINTIASIRRRIKEIKT